MTLVTHGALGKPALLTLVGLVIAIVLRWMKSPLRISRGHSRGHVYRLGAWTSGRPPNPVSMPDFRSVFFKLDILGALKLALLPAIITILFTDLFDSISTLIAVSQAANLLDEHGNPRNLREGLVVDSLATLGAGLAGSSSGTAYIESVAGIETGGRTGLTSVFTALCFLPCLFLAPLAEWYRRLPRRQVLILVGASMFGSVGQVSFSKIEEGLPAFLTMRSDPASPSSITQGISLGLHLARWTLPDGVARR